MAGRFTDSLILDQSDEELTLRESVAGIVSKYGRPYFQEKARAGQGTTELWNELAANGLVGVAISEEYGGGGAGLREMAIILEEAASQGCPMQLMVVSPTICGSVVQAHGSDEQKTQWLPGIADGSLVMAFAITEPDAGTNTHNISTTAHRTESGWRLSGAKYWTSGVDEADAVLVVAKDAELSTPEKPIVSMFIVPTDASGFSKTQIESALRAPERQFFTFYDDIDLPAEAIVGERGGGLRQLFVGLNPERVAAASIANGLSLYALGRASTYANERVVWKTPIGAHQGLAHPLAKAYIDAQQARMLTFRAADLVDSGRDAGEVANMAKLTAADAALFALDQAIQTHGGNGLSEDYGLSDLWFTARMLKTAPVSREMILNFIAQHSLGLPRSY